MDQRFTGCWTALTTPFNKDSTVDWDTLEKNLGFQSEQSVSGVLPMGSTGESATVTHEEHTKVIEKVNEWANMDVLAGTGSNNTAEAIYETQKASDCGITACLLVDCYYNKPSSIELRKEYYEVILAKFPEIEFISYAIPGRSVTAILPQDLAILRREYENLIAVKEATGDFERMKITRNLLDDDFNIISGDDPNTFEMMANPEINASGVISVISNITPKPIEEYTRLILEGKLDDAKEIENQLSPLFEIVGVTTTETIELPDGFSDRVTYKFPNPVPVKTMMNGLGMVENLCKRPLGKLTQTGVNMVRDALLQVWEDNPQHLEPIEGYFDVNLADRLLDDEIWKKLGY